MRSITLLLLSLLLLTSAAALGGEQTYYGEHRIGQRFEVTVARGDYICPSDPHPDIADSLTLVEYLGVTSWGAHFWIDDGSDRGGYYQFLPSGNEHTVKFHLSDDPQARSMTFKVLAATDDSLRVHIDLWYNRESWQRQR